MSPVVLLLVICAGVWYFVKQVSVAFARPSVWDKAEPAAAIVGAVGFSYVHHPFVWTQPDPMGVLLLRSLEFGVGVLVVALMLSIPMEREGLLRTPDGLAPPKARLLEQVASVNELDGDALAQYTEVHA